MAMNIALQNAVKNAVVDQLVGHLHDVEQVDNFKYVVRVFIDGQEEPCYAEVSIVAKNDKYDGNSLSAQMKAFEDKRIAAAERERERAAKRAEKAAEKAAKVEAKNAKQA